MPTTIIATRIVAERPLNPPKRLLAGIHEVKNLGCRDREVKYETSGVSGMPVIVQMDWAALETRAYEGNLCVENCSARKSSVVRWP